MTKHVRLIAGAAALATVGLTACQAPAPPAPQEASTSSTRQITAVVETVDQTTRQVLLRTPDGKRATVVAGPEVQNLAQLKSGDRVTITYRRAVAAQIARAGSTPPNFAVLGAARAAPGQLPGGAVGAMAVERVTVTGTQPDGTEASFVTADGISHTVDVRDPQMQAFVRGLKPGEKVDVGYAREVAISVARAP